MIDSNPEIRIKLPAPPLPEDRTCKPNLYETENTARRGLLRIAATVLGPFVIATHAAGLATAYVALQNPSDFITALQAFSSDQQYPKVDGCADYVPLEIPSITTDEPDTTMPAPPDDKTPEPEYEPSKPLPSKPSAMYKNSILSVRPWQTINQYRDFFDQVEFTHQSRVSGIEYVIYTPDFSGQENQYETTINTDVIEIAESMILSTETLFDRAEARHFMGCIRQYVTDNQNKEMRWPIVIPTSPACLGDLRIRTDISKSNCKQNGLTAPDTDIDIFPFGDVTPEDRFILLTTGNDNSKTPTVGFKTLLHELLHAYVIQAGGHEYSLDIAGEEDLVDYLTGAIMDYHMNEDTKPPAAVEYAQLQP